MNKLTIILPAYNEETTIKLVLDKAIKIPNSKVIIVDDGSTDKTPQVIMRIIKNKDDIAHIENETNRGKAFCVKRAFEMLNNEDIIIICDTDNQYDISEYNRLIEPIIKNEADYVIGSRDFSTVPFRHTLGNKLWSFTFNLLFGTNLKDTNCGFVAMKKEVAKRLKITGDRYVIDNEMMINALKNGYRLKNIPISINYHKKRNILNGISFVLKVELYLIKRWLFG